MKEFSPQRFGRGRTELSSASAGKRIRLIEVFFILEKGFAFVNDPDIGSALVIEVIRSGDFVSGRGARREFQRRLLLFEVLPVRCIFFDDDRVLLAQFGDIDPLNPGRRLALNCGNDGHVVGPIIPLGCDFGTGRNLSVQETILHVAEGDRVPDGNRRFFPNPLAVDGNAVRTPEIADEALVVHNGNATVFARDFPAVEQNDIALGMPADKEDRFVDDDGTALSQRIEIYSHTQRSEVFGSFKGDLPVPSAEILFQSV
jgi:hypothetical protein